VTDEQRQIGARIAAARREAGLTQRELADRLGVTTRSIQNYEAGAVTPYRHLRRIETLARKRVGWILSGDPSGDSMADTIARLEATMERHYALLQEQLDRLRNETVHLRELRELSEVRRHGGENTPQAR